MSQPDPTGESPVTTASRSLATALSKARFASGLLRLSYTTPGDTTTACLRVAAPKAGAALESVVHDGTTPTASSPARRAPDAAAKG